MTSTPVCQHCKSPIDDAEAPEGFCCTGCAAVHALIKENGLEKYYDLQRDATGPVCAPTRAEDLAWLTPLLQQAQARAGGKLATMDLDLQGLRCSACVWLLRELFIRKHGGAEAVINPALGRVTLTFPAGADVDAYLREAARLGYRAGPVGKAQDTASDGLLMRLGISAALTVNSMIFTLSHYMGMTPADTESFMLMRALNVALTLGVVLVGGGPFFKGAWAGLRMGHAGFDVPVAMGILLAFGGSLWMTATDLSTFGYLDTVNTFTTLMLVGRWMQERVLLQNRRQLLASQGLDGLHTRRVTDHGAEVVTASSLRRGDVVLLPMGAMLQVDATVADDHAVVSLDWVNGEPAPQPLVRGDDVPAGAFNADARPVKMTLARDFAHSSLLPLLARPLVSDDATQGPALLDRIARYYTPVVTTVAALGALAWAFIDPSKSLGVATSVLVVTCPCFLGLAIPLAWQRTAAGLRSRGVFVRRPRVLDAAEGITRVVFDKTGTLTLGALRVAEPRVLDALAEEERDALYTLTAQSSHPRSVCIHKALEKRGARWVAALSVTEAPGQGLEGRLCAVPAVTFRLGRASFASRGADAAAGAAGDEVWFSVDNVVKARVRVEEEARRDAADELHALQANGLRVAVLSGDIPARVSALADQLGLHGAETVGGMTPEGKAAWLRERGAEKDTLFVGDGVNDHAAFAAARACGTPAVDSGVLAASADFYFLTPGIRAVRDVLETGRFLARLTARIRNVALAYNALVVGACLLGWVSPLGAAITMPLSSLAFLTWAMRATAPAPASVSQEAGVAAHDGRPPLAEVRA